MARGITVISRRRQVSKTQPPTQCWVSSIPGAGGSQLRHSFGGHSGFGLASATSGASGAQRRRPGIRSAGCNGHHRLGSNATRGPRDAGLQFRPGQHQHQYRRPAARRFTGIWSSTWSGKPRHPQRRHCRPRRLQHRLCKPRQRQLRQRQYRWQQHRRRKHRSQSTSVLAKSGQLPLSTGNFGDDLGFANAGGNNIGFANTGSNNIGIGLTGDRPDRVRLPEFWQRKHRRCSTRAASIGFQLEDAETLASATPAPQTSGLKTPAAPVTGFFNSGDVSLPVSLTGSFNTGSFNPGDSNAGISASSFAYFGIETGDVDWRLHLRQLQQRVLVNWKYQGLIEAHAALDSESLTLASTSRYIYLSNIDAGVVTSGLQHRSCPRK